MTGSTLSSGDEFLSVVSHDDPEVVSKWIADGADVNFMDNRGTTPLMEAAVRGEEEIARILINAGASVDLRTESFPHPRTALLLAARHGCADIVRILLQNGADASQSETQSFSALHFAALNDDKDPEIASLLIHYGANVNLFSTVNGLYTPLYLAARRANAPVVSRLIRGGADVNLVVNARGETVLMRASSFPHCSLSEWDRRNGRQTETISLLLEAGANINAVSEDGETALLNAVENRGEDQVRVLIAYGADVNQGTAQGTPLIKALLKDLKMARWLVLAGADTANLPPWIFNEYLQPLMASLDELVTHHSSLITMAFVELKNSEQKDSMFKNAAFRNSFHEWDDLRIEKLSRIVSYLVTLKTEDLHVTYILAPFLANADLERLNRFGLVLSFLTAPCERKKTAIIEISKCSSEPELMQFIQATFKYAIIMGSFRENFDSFLDPMYTVYSNLIEDLGAIKGRLRRIADVNIGTVYQFRHGEFGVYSKFAEDLRRHFVYQILYRWQVS